jgi:adenylosuccinate synthase
MSINAIVGGQWGDEGKGKIVDLLSKNTSVVARYQGGANAGHTVYYNNKKIVLHQIPTGILRKNSQCILGKGMVLDPIGIVDEIQCLVDNDVNFKDRILIDFYAHVVTPIHKLIDKTNELRSGNKIGTTCKGIGPTYKDKYDRIGIRMIDTLDLDALKTKLSSRLDLAKKNNEIDDDDNLLEEFEQFYIACNKISQFVHDTFPVLYTNLNHNILIEGAQGTLLDIDHGTFPYVTSSNCTAGGISTGLGIPGNKLNNIIGIFKAYVTRVGSGPFPTELFDADGEKLQSLGKEFGATTGRPRRCGWFDLVAAKYSVQINGLTGIALTKLDILDDFDTIKVCTHYDYKGKEVKYLSSVINDLENVKPVYKEFAGWSQSVMDAKTFADLPHEAKTYIDFLEKELEVDVEIVSVGPKRDQILLK